MLRGRRCRTAHIAFVPMTTRVSPWRRTGELCKRRQPIEQRRVETYIEQQSHSQYGHLAATTSRYPQLPRTAKMLVGSSIPTREHRSPTRRAGINTAAQARTAHWPRRPENKPAPKTGPTALNMNAASTAPATPPTHHPPQSAPEPAQSPASSHSTETQAVGAAAVSIPVTVHSDSGMSASPLTQLMPTL
jgi:hypothetical protein